MKKIIFLVILAACLAAQPALAVKKKAPAQPHHPAAKAPEPSGIVEAPGKVITEPNAFHGVKWGTPLAAVPDLTKEERSGQAVYATMPNVVYRIGDAFLNNVVYAFCQDKFAAVMVEYQGRKAHESIKNFLAAKYTKPLELEGNPDSLGWPIGNVLIRMEFDSTRDAGALSYYYQPLYAPCAGGEDKAKP
jgi:hypothetical protein